MITYKTIVNIKGKSPEAVFNWWMNLDQDRYINWNKEHRITEHINCAASLLGLRPIAAKCRRNVSYAKPLAFIKNRNAS